MTRPVLLCATDLGPSGRRALDLAIRVARHRDLGVELLHVADLGESEREPIPAAIRAAADVYRRRIREHVEELSGRLEAERRRAEEAGVKCEARLDEGRPWEVILETAIRVEARLLVVDAHDPTNAREELRERILGSTADRVVRHATCPVLVATGELPPTFEGSKIVVGVDFSAASVDVVREAASLATSIAGELFLVHSVSRSHRALSGESEADELVSWWEESAREQLETLAAAEAPDVPVQLRITHGRAADALCAMAGEENASFLVVGTSARSTLARRVLGSTAERCLRRAKASVLVVHRSETPPRS